MKILFLDIDGPLIPRRSFFLTENLQPGKTLTFDPCVVGMLNFLYFAVPDLQVVFQSRRFGLPGEQGKLTMRSEAENLLKSNNVKIPLCETFITPRTILSTGDRTEDIKYFLQKYKVDNFAVLDDELVGYLRKPTEEERIKFNLVGENFDNGLTFDDLIQLLKIFNVKKSFVDLMKEYKELSYKSKLIITSN